MGSFSIDLTRYALLTKLYFIKRLMRLGKYLKEKKLRPDAVEPIKTILKQMRDYIVQSGEKLNTSQGLISSIAAWESSALGQLPSGNIQQSLVQSKQIQPLNSPLQSQGRDIVYLSAAPEDVIEEKKDHQRIIQESIVEFSNRDAIEKKDKVVIFPEYELKNGKVDYFSQKMDKVPRGGYLELGYDSANAENKNKHYRLVLNKPLEETNYLSNGMFEKTPVFRGKQLASDKMWLANLFFKEEPYKEVGLFRGDVKLIEEKYLQDIMNLGLGKECKKLQLPSSQYEWEYAVMDGNVINDKKVKLVIYIVDAQIIKETDIGSNADPYIVLKIGHTTISVESLLI